MSLILRRANPGGLRILARWNQTSSKKSQSSEKIPDVKGLSSNCVQVPNSPVGPGAAKTGDYKNVEYFCYNDVSYFEAEVEMEKYRIPQPSNKAK